MSSPPSDRLPADLSAALAPLGGDARLRGIAARIVHFPTIGSTNDVAATLAASGERSVVVVADEQTAGRGRRGRVWFSPPGSGLYVSLLLAPARAASAPARATALVTLTAGVALAEAVEATTGLSPDIKWPNDLLIGRRKVAGILAEGIAAAEGVALVVIGYGINVAAAAYPPELADRVTSLATELGRPVDRAALFASSLAALAARYDDLLHARVDVILDGWRRRAPASRGARVEWDGPDGRQSGRTAGIDDWGALLVRTATGVERIRSGELMWP